jgi:hypothetical protein
MRCRCPVKGCGADGAVAEVAVDGGRQRETAALVVLVAAVGVFHLVNHHARGGDGVVVAAVDTRTSRRHR